MKDVTTSQRFGTTPTTPETTALTALRRDCRNYGPGSATFTGALAKHAETLFRSGGWRRCFLDPEPRTPAEFLWRAVRMTPPEVIAAMSPERARGTRGERQGGVYAVDEDTQLRVQALLIDRLAGEIGPRGRPERTPADKHAGQGDAGVKPAGAGFPYGSSNPVYRRRRLLAEAPDLVERVDAGELSLADAWREHTGGRGDMSLNGSPEQIAERLRGRLGAELFAQVCREMAGPPPPLPEVVVLGDLHRDGAGTAELSVAARAAREAGASPTEIADAAGVSTRTVRRWVSA